MSFWTNLQRKIVNQNTRDDRLRVTLLAGVLSSDPALLQHRHEPTLSQEPIDPRQTLYGEKKIGQDLNLPANNS